MGNSYIKKFIPFSIGILILSILISKIGIGNIIGNIKIAYLPFVLISFTILLLTILLKTIRWNILVKSLSQLNNKNASMIYCIGQATNEVLPTGSGDLIRMYYIKKISKISFLKPVSAVLYERLFDLALLLIISTVGIFIIISEKLQNLEDMHSVFLITFFIVGVFLIVLLKPGLVKNFLFVLSRKVTIFSKLNDLFDIYESGRNVIKNERILLALILSIAAWFFEALCQSILVNSFGFEIPFSVMLSIVAISWLVGTFSFIPGGLGAREVVFAILLSFYGISIEIGSSIAILYRGFVYFIFGILASFSFLMIKVPE